MSVTYTRSTATSWASSNQVTLLGLGANIVGLILLLTFRGELAELALPALCNFASVCVLLVLGIAVWSSPPSGIWSPASVYLIVFSLFHFGLTSVLGLGLLSEDMQAQVAAWLYKPSTKQAILLALIGLLSCGAGAQLSYLLGKRSAPTTDSGGRSTTDDKHLYYYLSIIGSLLVLVSVAYWFASITFAGEGSLLFGSYEEYLEATSSSSGAFSLIWFGLGVGLCFSATSPPSNWRRLSFGIFVIFALFALPIGLRGEVLFPTLAAAVIAVRRRRKLPSIRVALLVGSAILVAIALFHDVRQVGLQNFSNSALSGNLLDGLAEMGGTLRPVVEVTRWHNSGEEFIKGASYLAPFDRALDVILDQPRLAAENDVRLMNVLVVIRNLGHIGFSPVAEAYHNFATLGVVAVMSGIGLLVGRMSQWPLTASYQALIGIILVELLINVRNAFVSVPVHIIVGCLLLSTVVIVARSIETGQRSHPGSLKAYSASRPLQRR